MTDSGEQRILIVEDHAVMADSLAMALRLQGYDQVRAAPTSDLSDAAVLGAVEEHRPDVVLLDMGMPVMSGGQLLTTLRDSGIDVRVLVVSAMTDQQTMFDAVAEGAAGFLTKRAAAPDLVDAVLTVHAGGSVIAPSVTSELMKEYALIANGGTPTGRAGLDRDERHVLRLVARGLTDHAIGAAMHISPRTVQNRLAGLRAKTGVRRRSELARWAAEHAAN